MRQGALSTNAYCRHALKVFVFPILQDVKAIFKGVTYESLSDPEFMRIAGQKIPSLDRLHEEFDAAKAEDRTDEKEAPPS
jgi:hypothetical protein